MLSWDVGLVRAARTKHDAKSKLRWRSLARGYLAVHLESFALEVVFINNTDTWHWNFQLELALKDDLPWKSALPGFHVFVFS